MKIRLDFVTNSSSSSFIAVVQQCKYEEFLAGHTPPDKEVVCFGGYLSEGRDLISLTKEMAQFIVDNWDNFDNYDKPDEFCYIILDQSSSDGGASEIVLTGDKMSMATPKFGPLRVVSDVIDYHCSESIDDIKSRYMRD